MEDRDQRHKGRETFFALLLDGLNLVATSAALVAAIQLEDPLWLSQNGLYILGLLVSPLVLHMAGCRLLLDFETSVHPWRHLGKERERHCWGKLQGTKRGIEVEPTIWVQVSWECYPPVFTFTFTGNQ